MDRIDRSEVLSPQIDLASAARMVAGLKVKLPKLTVSRAALSIPCFDASNAPTDLANVLESAAWRQSFSEHNVRLAQVPESRVTSRSFALAIDKIDSCFPEAAMLSRLLIARICIVEFSDSDHHSFSASFLENYGTLFTTHRASWPHAFLTLLHETAHHEMFLKQCYFSFAADPNLLLYSPIRDQWRPAMGVLHSAHVLQRMLLGLRRCQPTTGEFDLQADIAATARMLHETVDVLSHQDPAWLDPDGQVYQMRLLLDARRLLDQVHYSGDSPEASHGVSSDSATERRYVE